MLDNRSAMMMYNLKIDGETFDLLLIAALREDWVDNPEDEPLRSTSHAAAMWCTAVLSVRGNVRCI
jgi:hypothetical protein